jgi:transposase
MLADELDYVIGVDTHRDEHVIAVLTVPAGAVVAGMTARANARGYRELLRVVERYGPGRRGWAVEGTGSYGAGLARYLCARGEAMLEVSRTPRTERRLRGKDDCLDAVRTARAALAAETLALPRAGERREALRLLLVARRSAVDVRREALTQLRAVIVTAPDRLRQELRGLSTGKLLDRCSRLRRTHSSADELATRLVLRSLAKRVQAGTLEADELEGELLAHVRALASASRRSRRRTGRCRTADRRLVASPAACARKPASPVWPASTRSPPPAAKRNDIASAAAATVNSTAHCTRSRFTAACTTRRPRTTSRNG